MEAIKPISAADLARWQSAISVSRTIVTSIRARAAYAEIEWIVRNSCKQIADARACMNRLDDALRREHGAARPAANGDGRAKADEAAA